MSKTDVRIRSGSRLVHVVAQRESKASGGGDGHMKRSQMHRRNATRNKEETSSSGRPDYCASCGLRLSCSVLERPAMPSFRCSSLAAHRPACRLVPAFSPYHSSLLPVSWPAYAASLHKDTGRAASLLVPSLGLTIHDDKGRAGTATLAPVPTLILRKQLVTATQFSSARHTQSACGPDPRSRV